MVLKNVGSQPCRRLRLLTSCPGLAAAAASAGGTAAAAPGMSAAEVLAARGEEVAAGSGPHARLGGARQLQGSSSGGAAGGSEGVDGPAFMYPIGDEGFVLEPGASVQWPLWLHAGQAGQLQLHCVWVCEPQVSAGCWVAAAGQV